MRRTLRPRLESLEAKAQLSVAPASASGLVSSLVAVVHRSSTGTQVVATLTETNTTNHDITVDHGPPTDGFFATQRGKSVWVSNGGIVAQFLQVEVLKPHQSFSIGATWDGRLDQAGPLDPSKERSPITGTVTISSELDHGSATATVTLGRHSAVPPNTTHVPPPRPAAIPH